MIDGDLCIIHNFDAVNKKLDTGVIIDEGLYISTEFNRVHIIVYSNDGYYSYKYTDKLHIHMIPVFFRSKINNLYLLYGLSKMFSLTLFLSMLMIKYDIKLIRAQDPLLTGFVPILLSKIFNFKSTVKCAGSMIDTIMYQTYSEEKKPLLISIFLQIVKIIIQFVYISANHVFSVDIITAERALSYGAKKITIIGVYLDTTKFSPKKTDANRNNDKMMLCVARLDPVKGLQYLVRSAILLRNERVNYVIAGDGPLKKELTTMIIDHRLNDKVKLIGNVPHSKMPELFNRVDFFILPSLSEGLPVALLEAMASGKPIISTAVGGLSKLLVHRVNALIIQPENDVEIAEAIVTLMNDPHLCEVLSANARRSIEKKYSPEKWLLSQMRIFVQLIK